MTKSPWRFGHGDLATLSAIGLRNNRTSDKLINILLSFTEGFVAT